MIQVFLGARPLGASDMLDAMHRDRKRIFVDLLKWDVPVIDDSFEVDQFDDERAIYLVATDPDGRHRGSIRLLPTTSDHILGSVFPWLCDGDVPRASTIYEISRGCLSPQLSPRDRRLARNKLTSAVVEFALLHGISSYTCIADSAWLNQIPSLGWECRPLGVPRRLGRARTGALRIGITPDTPHRLRETGTYAAAALIFEENARKAAA